MRPHTTDPARTFRLVIVIVSLVGALLASSAVGVSAGPLDRDGDGLRNRFERLHTHTNPRVADSDHDGRRDGRENPDHDGLANRQEQRLHTDPRDADTDDDVCDSHDDEDCDGVENRDEFRAGTNPLQADSDHDGIDDGDEDDDDDPSCDFGDDDDDDADDD